MSRAAKAVLTEKYRHVRAHTWVAGNEFVDVDAELGRRLRCTSLSWLWEGYAPRREGEVFSLYDALWWTDQLDRPDPLMERGRARPSVGSEVELNVGLANVRIFYPATDEPETHSDRRRVLADAFSRKHIDVVGLQETCTPSLTIRVCGGFSHGHLD